MSQQEEDRIEREIQRSFSGSDPFAAAVRATRMPMVITDPRLPENPIVFVNDAFARLTGYDREETLGKNCRFLQGLNTDRADVARIKDAIISRTTIEVDLLNYKKDGTSFWNRLLVSPVFDNGELTYFFASQYDVTMQRERLVVLERDREKLESEVNSRTAELKASEEMLRFALDAGKLGVWTIDLKNGRLAASTECKAICGRGPDDQLTLEELQQSIHPEDRTYQREAIAEAIEKKSLLDAEYRLTTPAGEERWVQIRARADYATDGTPLSITGTTQDVTTRRLVQGQRALLAQEMNHRVKNTLASLQAVVAQTIRTSTSLKEAGTTLAERIHAMAAANELLITEDFNRAGIRDLIFKTLAPFGVEDKDRFRLAGPDVHLPPQVVVAYALALHELATNAAKYGALNSPEGAVTIEWEVQNQSLLHLVWKETGGPPVEAPKKTSFGTKLIQRVLATELGGRADIDYRPDGLVFTAVAPLPDTATANQVFTRVRPQAGGYS